MVWIPSISFDIFTICVFILFLSLAEHLVLSKLSVWLCRRVQNTMDDPNEIETVKVANRNALFQYKVRTQNDDMGGVHVYSIQWAIYHICILPMQWGSKNKCFFMESTQRFIRMR